MSDTNELFKLPDDSGCFTMSTPLPADHWLFVDEDPALVLHCDVPVVRSAVRLAAKKAIRAATDNGRIIDFDPDCMVQHFLLEIFGVTDTVTVNVPLTGPDITDEEAEKLLASFQALNATDRKEIHIELDDNDPDPCATISEFLADDVV